MTELLQWWNLIFVLPFVAALFYVVLLGVGAVPGGHDAEFNVGVESDVGIEHDADLDHGAGVEHVHDIEPGILARVLSLLGIGRVPLSIIVVSFCFLWGFLGFACNSLLKPVLPAFLFVWASLLVALSGSVILTRILALSISRVMPATETYAVSLEELSGKWGEAITRIDETFGQAHVHDDAGALHTVQCVTRTGAAPIPKDSQVLLMFYDKERGVFLVGTDLPSEKPE